MSTTRQDAWTQDEDLLLAEVVLRHIREGGTQLQAFEEVGRKLSRTAAACGFRWNSTIRKKYKSGIEIAKKQRKESKKVQSSIAETGDCSFEIESFSNKTSAIQEKSPSVEKEMSYEDCINYLNKLYDQAKNTTYYQKSLSNYENKIKLLEHQITNMTTENEKLAKELYAMEHDYKALIEIMERARKMVVLKDEEFAQKARFQMDKNGNLEKLDK